MNGFTNAILSLLLGWIRLFINQFWNMANSEEGGRFIQFLGEHWKMIFLLLCIVGFVADKLVYLFRWRPYYVWRSRRRRLAQEWSAYQEDPPSKESDPATKEALAQDVFEAYPHPATIGASGQDFAPAGGTAVYHPSQLPQQTNVYPSLSEENLVSPYQRPPSAPVDASPSFAPAAKASQPPVLPYAAPYHPPENLSPLFDEALDDWAPSDAQASSLRQNIHQVASGLEQTFGSAKPEPVDYLRDMQAGFAKPLPPEQLYAPKDPAVPVPLKQPAPLAPSSPVHPGLNMADFRKNIGLAPAGSLEEGERPAFQAFASASKNEETPGRRNPFAGIAKKAKGLVGVGDEDNPLTIRDLQSSVDMRTAFNEPVYPKPLIQEEEDLSDY